MIHLVSAADESYAPGLCVTVASSLVFLSPAKSVTFHILNGGLAATTLEHLQALCKSSHPRCLLVFHDINPQAFQGWQPGPNNSMMAYARLLLGSLLQASKMIYLDADMIVLSDLVELWTTPMNGKIILAARGGEHAILSGDCPWKLSSEEKILPYINSGVMIIDLDQWRLRSIEQEIKELVHRSRMNLACYDQTILNYLLRHDIGLLPMSWNWQGRLLSEAQAASAKIIHFITPKKPWFWWSDDDRFCLWRAFYNLYFGSPFQLFIQQKAWRGLFYGVFETTLRRYPLLRWCYIQFLSLTLITLAKMRRDVRSIQITWDYYTKGLGGKRGDEEFKNSRSVLPTLLRRLQKTGKTTSLE